MDLRVLFTIKPRSTTLRFMTYECWDRCIHCISPHLSCNYLTMPMTRATHELGQLHPGGCLHYAAQDQCESCSNKTNYLD